MRRGRTQGWAGVVLLLPLVLGLPPALTRSQPSDPRAGDVEVRQDPLAEAQAAEARRDWKAAATAYDALLAGQPGHVGALTGLARCRLRLDEFGAALDLSAKARTLAPEDGEVLTVHGEALIRAGEPERAAEILPQAVARAPGSARAHLGLARLLLARGEDEKGIEHVLKAHELSPDDPDILLRYAGALARRQEAIAALERYLVVSEGVHETERRESVRGTLAMYKALGEEPVWVLESRPERCELPLQWIGRGGGVVDGYILELSARAADGQKDRPLRCLVDSGATGLFLSAASARRLARRELSGGAIYGGGGTGRHEVTRMLLARVAAGEIAWTQAIAYAGPEDVDVQGRYDGIIGLDVFESWRITLDFPARKLRLESAPESAGGPGAGAIPVWKIEGHLLVRSTLGREGTGLMMLDTGASRCVVDIEAARSIPGISRRPRTARTYGFGGTHDRAEDVEGLLVALGPGAPQRIRAIGLDLSRRSRLIETRISGFLGLDVLRKYAVRFDPGLKRVRLDPPGG